MRQRCASPSRRAAMFTAGLLACLSWGVTAHAAALALEIELRPAILYVGDSGQMDLRVSGGRSDTPPKIESSPDWEIQLIKTRPENYRRERWINGKHKVEQFHGTIFTYRLTPQRAGELQVGDITISDGRTQQHHDGPLIPVRPPDTDAAVRLFLTADSEPCYVGQSTTIKLTIEVAAIKGDYAASEPIWPDRPPHLRCNLFDQHELAGIERINLRDELQGMLSSRTRTPAFIINDYESEIDRFPFTGLPGVRMSTVGAGGRTPIRFRLPAERVDQPGGRVWRYTTALTCTFNATGRYTFGPASLEGEIIREADQQGRPIMRRISLLSEPLVIEIDSAPQQGRPTSYIGVMATNLQVHAALDTQTCNVGDPLTLTLTIDGAFDRSASAAPAIQHQRDLTTDFTIYGDTVRSHTTDTGKRYDYQIRPRRAGTLEVPPLDVSFFDTTRDAYITVQTAPIPVRANQAEHLSNAAILAGPSAAIAIDVSDSAEEFTPAPLLPLTAGPEAILQPWHRLLFASGPLLFAIAFFTRLIGQHSPALARRRRRDRALGRALGTLQDPDLADEQRILSACRGYLADVRGIASTVLNPADMQPHFAALGSAATADEITALVATAFNATFAPSAAPDVGDAATPLSQQAADLLQQLDSERRAS
jgi:hypothetical protein